MGAFPFDKVKAKNDVKHQELIGYIKKHQEEIDYDQRKKVGKDVDDQSSSNGKAFKKAGSVEKACDSVIIESLLTSSFSRRGNSITYEGGAGGDGFAKQEVIS